MDLVVEENTRRSSRGFIFSEIKYEADFKLESREQEKKRTSLNLTGNEATAMSSAFKIKQAAIIIKLSTSEHNVITTEWSFCLVALAEMLVLSLRSAQK